jgi:glutamate--cysteine ligase
MTVRGIEFAKTLAQFDPRRSANYDHPIVMTFDDLVAHFRAGEKREKDVRVGMEHEKIGVLADGRAPDYDRIARLLEAMVARGWSRIEEGGKLIALERPICGTITLEPGGQTEHSGAPWPTAVQAVADNKKHLDELLPLAAELGIRYLGVGFRPFGTLDDVPWMPKGRYRVMREYLPTRGKLAHEMMKRTATVQANLDYTDEQDAMEKLRIALALSSPVNALFAASPIVDGKPSGYQSYRGRVWLDTDPDRCGLLPWAFKEGAGFRDYAEWALDVPMFFIKRDGEYRKMHLTFRQFMREGWQGERASLADWELHLSTLFPEVRLKRYVEVRQADASTREMVHALPVLWRTLLYVRDAREAAWALVRDWTLDERLQLYRETGRLGLRATIRGRTLREIAGELVAIAKRGAIALQSPDGVALLAPLEEIAATGRTVADRILDVWNGAKGDPAKVIDALALK